MLVGTLFDEFVMACPLRKPVNQTVCTPNGHRAIVDARASRLRISRLPVGFCEKTDYL